MKNFDLQVEYQLRQKIDEYLDSTILPNIESLVENAKLCGQTRMKNSQFSNLQNVARDTTSVQVILTWVQYQTGRQAAWRDNNFGRDLLQQLESLQGVAESILQEIETEIGTANAGDDFTKRYRRRLWLDLIRQYAGHLQRRFIACQGDTV